MLGALARLEAEIDFGPDGEEVPAAELDAEIAELAGEMATQLADRRGELLREGVTVAVTGPPNVGKSSLVNALAQREVALVSEHPGTTRDVIEVQLEIAGVPVTLLDTAGLRATEDPVEAMGVSRARARAAAADLELRLFIAGTPLPAAAANVLRVASKRDLDPGAPLPASVVAVPENPASQLARADSSPASAPCARRKPKSTSPRPRAAMTHRAALLATIVW